MRVVTKRTLNLYAEQHPLAKRALLDWHRVVSGVAWTNPHELKTTFGNASVINRERVVFNIHGNAFRLIVALDYQRQSLFIKWFGTHADYDRIDAATVTWEDMP